MALFSRKTAIERLAKETGWLVGHREGERYSVYADSVEPMQYVHIRYSQKTHSVTFQSWLGIRFPLANPPSGLFGRLLIRSFDLVYASWAMDIAGSCEASPCVLARLHTTALTAELFNKVCRETVDEVAAFRKELQDKFRYDLGDAWRPAAAQPGAGMPTPRLGGGIVWLDR